MNQDSEEEPIRALMDLLFEKWDPIGVNPIGAPRTHYARYARGVVDVWLATQDERQVLAYLRRSFRKCLGEDEALDGPSVSVAKDACVILRSFDQGDFSSKGFGRNSGMVTKS